MTKALVAAIMSVLELIELWTGYSLTGLINEQWIETLLMVLAPILVLLVPDHWLRGVTPGAGTWPGRGA